MCCLGRYNTSEHSPLTSPLLDSAALRVFSVFDLNPYKPPIFPQYAKFSGFCETMTTITIKGHEFTPLLARDSFGRRAVQYKNNLIKTLSQIGVPSDDVIVDIEPVAIKNVPASATWYAEGYRMHYS